MLLFDVVFAHECTSTHHKLALDALRYLRDSEAHAWRNLFLRHFDQYLEGAKAPDDKFRDFRNHVLHVRDNRWGGALTTAERWYGNTVRAFRQGKWSDAVYAAGVLSHYFTDPFQPLHTHQSEDEAAVHRAIEWSICKSYEELQNILVEDLGGYPEVAVPEAEDWLRQMILHGAELARPHYELLIDHYDLSRGEKHPRQGLDQESKDCIARLIGQAVVGFSRVLDRAFDEAGIRPPAAGVGWLGGAAWLTTPFGWLAQRREDRRQRSQIRAMHREWNQTGRVVSTLPEEQRVIRQLHAKEVLNKPVRDLERTAPRPWGTKHGDGAVPRVRSRRPVTAVVRLPAREAPAEAESPQPPDTIPLRFYLRPSSDVADAPSIGEKTARRLAKLGVQTVGDLLTADPDVTAERLAVRHISAETIRDWQAQSRLVCRVPNLRAHDAQILVGCNLTEPSQIASQAPEELFPTIEAFTKTREGQQILRFGGTPDREEVGDWIQWSRRARPLAA